MLTSCCKAYRGVFVSPSCADADPSASDSRSTKPSNAAIMGMEEVTPGSIAYITVQVWSRLSEQGKLDASLAILSKDITHDTFLFHHFCLLKHFIAGFLCAELETKLQHFSVSGTT